MNLRVAPLELAQQDRKDAATRTCGGADLEPALELALCFLAELREQLLLQPEEPLRASVEPEPGFGRLHPTTRTVEEPLADPLLERADLQADCRLRDAELVRGLREAPALDDCTKGGELLRIHKNTL